MTDLCKHRLWEMKRDVPRSAWGVVILETEDGPSYHGIPEPETGGSDYREIVNRLQANPDQFDQQDIVNVIDDTYDLIVYGHDPVALQALMTIHGHVCVVNMMGEEDSEGDSITFIPCEGETVLNVAKKAIEQRTYGETGKHVITAEWLDEQQRQAEEHFENAADSIMAEILELMAHDTYDDGLMIRKMLDYPDNPLLCEHVKASAIEAPVTLEIFDIALEIKPGRKPSTAQKEDFERHILAVLGEALEHGSPQSVSWQRFQLKAKAEEIRSAMGISMVYIAAYTEKQEIIMGLAREGKDPVLLLSAE